MIGTAHRIVVAAAGHDVDSPSGATHIAYDSAYFLAGKGHDVWLVAPTSLADTPEWECTHGVNLLRYCVPELNPLNPRRARVHQEATKAVLRRHVPGPVQIVYGHAPLQYQGACELYGDLVKNCYTVHSPVMQEMEQTWSGSSLTVRLRRGLGLRRLNRIERDCLRRCDRITVLSEFTRGALRKLHGAEFDSKIVTLPGWVDLERFKPIEDRVQAKARLGWRTDVAVFFTLRRLVRRMGLDRLLRAARKLLDRAYTFQLVIGGAGPLSAALQRLSKDLGLHNTVQFAGQVSDENLPLMYAACDAFVLPSAALECFGLITLEALACGRPVLATPVGAIPEVLARFEIRWLASSVEEGSIAEIMDSFLRGDLPSHSAEELRGIAKRFYDRDLILNALANLILN